VGHAVKLTLRDLFWLVLIGALAVAWRMDRKQLENRWLDELRAAEQRIRPEQ